MSELLRVADTTGWRLQRERARVLARSMILWGGLIALLGCALAAAGLAGW